MIICFTGNRPKGLPWGYEEQGVEYDKVKSELMTDIELAISNGNLYFISGMALGVDMICAEIILDLKQKYKNIVLECALPCENQTLKWARESVERYNKIISQADIVTYVSKEYSIGCMQKRNKYMVDKSDLVIAVYNGKEGGTKQTIDYAIKCGKKVKIIKV